MTSKPFLDERRLKKALTEQGFTLTPTSKGTRVLAPDGEGTAMIHPSVFGSQQGRRAYHNNIAQLVRVGFDLDKIDAPEANGKAAEWKADQVEVEKLVSEQEAASRAKAEAEQAETAVDLGIRKAIRDLSGRQRELYDLVVERPGLQPQQYAGHLGWERGVLSNHGSALTKLGLIEASGSTKSRRYWVAGQVGVGEGKMSVSGRPSASPVRTRQMEPADAVVRFKKMGERAMRLKTELEGIIGQMVEQYADQENELKLLRAKVARLEGIIGRAVDAL